MSLFKLNDHFSEFHVPGCKNHLGGRPSGGLSLLVRKSISKCVSIVFSDSYHIWCKLNKNEFGWDRDLSFVSFISPQAVQLYREQGNRCHLKPFNQNVLITKEKGGFYYAETSMLERMTSMIILKMTNWVTICQ